MTAYNSNPTLTTTGLHDYMRYYASFIQEISGFIILIILLHIMCFRAFKWLENKLYPPTKPPSPFSKLPPELLLCIIDQCSPGTQAVLASTSKDFREATKRWYSVKRSDLDASWRAEAVFALAKDLPDKAPCWDCGILHEVDITDTPPTPSFGRNEHNNLDSPYYQITHAHVALALKFHRLGIQSEYLSRLMKPQCTQVISFGGSILKTLIRVKRRITNGRFLLRITIQELFYLFGHIAPCEHIKFNSLYKRKGRAPRSDRPCGILHDEADPENTVSFATSCRKCRIDVEITVSPQNWMTVSRQSWIMDIWMDLGTETREGLYDNFSAEPFALPVPNPIDQSTRRCVPHERGSIKRLWESGKNWGGEEVRCVEG